MLIQPDKQHVIYAASNQDIRIYDYGNQQDIWQYSIGANIACITTTSNHQILVVGDANGLFHFFNAQDYEPMGQIDLHQPITSCIFNQNDSLLVTGNASGQITLWGINS